MIDKMDVLNITFIKLSEILVPAILAFIGAMWGARKAYKSQMHSSAISAFIPARLEAYGKFESAIKAVTNGVSREVAADIYEAANSAKLVASDATFAAIDTVQELVRCAEKGKHVDSVTFFAARQELLSCMRNDLSSYPVPKAQSK